MKNKLKNELNQKQLKNMCEAVNPMKQKKDGKLLRNFLVKKVYNIKKFFHNKEIF